MGVVDSFSLKQALGSGLTSVATAGISNGLGVGGTEQGMFTKTSEAKDGFWAGKQVLNSAGKAVMAASSAVVQAGSNKLVGMENSGFRWSNVAAGMASAYGGSELGLNDAGSAWGKTVESSFGQDLIGGVVHSGMNYVVTKGVFNEGSWNFKQIAADAFGNALGNAIVSVLERSEAEKNYRNRFMKSMDEHFAQVSERIAQHLTNESIANIRFEDPRAEFARLTASGEIDNLSEEQYSALATAATALDDASTIKFKAINSGWNSEAGIKQLNNYYQYYAETYNQTVTVLNDAWDAGTKLRAENAKLSQYTQMRYERGKAQVRADMQRFELQGFNANYMTEADWQDIASNQFSNWNRELTSDVMDIVTAPLMLTGFGYAGMRLMGAGALKLAQGAFRGSMIHGSSKLAATKTMLYGGAQMGAGDFLIDRGINFAQKSLTGSNNVINDMHRVGKQIYHEAKRNGGITVALGGTAGASAGTGVDGAVGHFVSVDFNKGNFTYGGYLSGEMASNLGIPAPEAHGGGEISIYPTSKYQDALKGPYTIYGGEFDAKLGAVSAGLVKTNNGQLTGFQASLVFSTPSLTKLPGHSAFIRAGGGTATEVLSFNYKNWW